MMTFGGHSVFHHVDSINAGARFKENIDEATCGSDVFLAAIRDRSRGEIITRIQQTEEALAKPSNYVLM